MNDAQQSTSEDHLLGTTTGATLVHVGLAWVVAAIVAVYCGFWFVLVVPALGITLWIISLPITRALHAHSSRLTSPEFRTSTTSTSSMRPAA